VTEGVQRLVMQGVRINGQPATVTSHQAAPPSDAERLPSDVRLPAVPKP
jgi:hypothetical protein